MTPAEKSSFLAQFLAARSEVAELARLAPECFDAAGRPIVATLQWPPDPQSLERVRQWMNKD